MVRLTTPPLTVLDRAGGSRLIFALQPRRHADTVSAKETHMVKKTAAHGGTRTGAGRPKVAAPKENLMLRVPANVRAFLRQQPNVSKFVADLVSKLKAFKEQFPE